MTILQDKFEILGTKENSIRFFCRYSVYSAISLGKCSITKFLFQTNNNYDDGGGGGSGGWLWWIVTDSHSLMIFVV